MRLPKVAPYLCALRIVAQMSGGHRVSVEEQLVGGIPGSLGHPWYVQ